MMEDAPLIYLDHAAATPITDAALETMVRAYREAPANPASLSTPGRKASAVLEDARDRIARTLGVRPDRVILTSGGTEANNLAVLGALPDPEGAHVVLSAIEHPSVDEAARRLARQGAEVTRVPPEPNGVVDPQRFAAAATERTRLACLMHVNNELGTIQPVAEATAALRARAPRCQVLVDAVQSFCREPVAPLTWGADFVSLSSHKIGGPRGVGALVALGSRPAPLLAGGEQEWSVRPGTQNPAGVAGFAEATERAHATREERRARAFDLRQAMETRIGELLPEARVNGQSAPRTPWIVSVSVAGIASEPLLRAMEELGVVASAGAACHARSRSRSHVLEAIGVPKTWGTARFSFGAETLEADALRAAEALAEAVTRYAL